MFWVAPKKSSNSRDHEISDVPKNTSADELLQGYQKAAINNHPDKGGDPEKGRRQKRGADVVHPLTVSLEELYNGTSRKLRLNRLKICSKCKGTGSKPLAECCTCLCLCMNVSIWQRGPGMTQQMQQVSSDCMCSVKTSNKRDRCPQCKGEKVEIDRQVITVNVDKGMKHNQKITLAGLADEAPDTVTGDIVLVLRQKDHAKFKRNGDDLFYEHTLTFCEALCGYQFVLAHLDGRQLLIKSKPGGQYKAINDEGMPNHHDPFMKGRLYIHFSVDFPESGSFTRDQRKALKAILPPKSSSEMTCLQLEECDETILQDVNSDEELRLKQQQAASDPGPRGPPVSCAQQ